MIVSAVLPQHPNPLENGLPEVACFAFFCYIQIIRFGPDVRPRVDSFALRLPPTRLVCVDTVGAQDAQSAEKTIVQPVPHLPTRLLPWGNPGGKRNARKSKGWRTSGPESRPDIYMYSLSWDFWRASRSCSI